MSSLKHRPNHQGDSTPREPTPANEDGFWRSLSELEGSPEFQKFLEREFPEQQEVISDPLSRRRFVQLMGASLAFAGVAGCRWEEDHIVPLSRRPDGYVPGVPREYATAWEIGGVAEGFVVTAFDGRPTKVEGNAQHPYTGGASSTFAQASILELYDPDRSRRIRRTDKGQGLAASWDDFVKFAAGLRDSLAGSGGLRILSEATSSPTVDALRREISARIPGSRWHEYEPLSQDNAREGTRMAFGAPHRVHLRLDRAALIATFDAELFAGHPASLRYARDFAAGRDPERGTMSRLYSVESTFSLTGAAADHRMPVRAELVKPMLLGLEQILLGGDPGSVGSAALSEGPIARFLTSLAEDLAANRGRGVVAVGSRQPADVHAIAARINERLSNSDRTVFYTPDAERPHHVEDLKALTADMAQGKVDTLLIIGGNPAYDAPTELDFGGALSKVKNAIHLSSYDNETSVLCSWHINRAHYLESWGDARSYDGTLTLIQPVIRPIHGGASVLDVLKIFAGQERLSSEDLVKQTFMTLTNNVFDGDKAWRKALHDGHAARTAFTPVRVTVGSFEPAPLTASQKGGTSIGNGSLEVVFDMSSQTYDGRFANNGWLVETPDFMTKLTWDNAALISPRTARDLGIDNGEMVHITLGDRKLKMVALIQPGQAPYSIGLPLGWGRKRAGHVGGLEGKADSIGFDTYQLRTSAGFGFASGASVKGTGAKYPLGETQDHFALEMRARKEIDKRTDSQIQMASLKKYQEKPDFVLDAAHIEPDRRLIPPEGRKTNLSLFNERDWSSRENLEGEEQAVNQWGMSTDLSKCIGCNSCLLACQAENNVPVVGKEQVMKNREMHWIRLDRFFLGSPDNPRVAHQPMYCQQCESAPCEQVCPVGATVHSVEGLNDMAYNRCVGTRYCANNCPYKVRRFNYHYWHKELDEARAKVKELVFNPDVTVRSRGVMEKCTWCVQRIERVKIKAKNKGRSIADGEIQTACQQACPTGAITFGNLSEEASRVTALHKLPRAYGLLSNLNTKPRHAFLARIENPNPALVEEEEGDSHE